MKRVLLKSKIHRAEVTCVNLEYEGSLSIDETLMETADILPFEQVKVYNITNGIRFDTYAMAGERGSGEVCLNGAAARLGARGDRIIIATYGLFDENEAKSHRPKIVLAGPDNRCVEQLA